MQLHFNGKLAEEFKAWKKLFDPCSSKVFGRDVATKVPVGQDFNKLMHVHLIPLSLNGIPEDAFDYNKWMRNFESKTEKARCRDRVSNIILYYATYGADYLLITKSNHGELTPDKINAMCEIANKWVAKLNEK
jgi:hypothetical protein